MNLGGQCSNDHYATCSKHNLDLSMKTLNWEEDFKEKFSFHFRAPYATNKQTILESMVRVFISSLLESQRQEIIREIKEIEGDSLVRSLRDLKGNCDFERVETCRRILSLRSLQVNKKDNEN